MSYNTLYTMVQDGDLNIRFIACAANENIPNPDSWVSQNRWRLMTIDAEMESQYEYSVGIGHATPGKREDVITDLKILTIVQAVLAELQV